VHCTDLLIPHTLPTSVHSTVVNASKGRINLKFLCSPQQLQFQPQSHFGFWNTYLVWKSEKKVDSLEDININGEMKEILG